MEEKIYIRLKKQIEISTNTDLLLSDFATVIAPDHIVQALANIKFDIPFANEQDRTAILDSFHILQHILKQFPDAYVQFIGTTDVLIEKKGTEKPYAKWLLFFIWIVLCIGAMITIINFHYDVNMQEVHRKIHFVLTGEQKTNPLTIQIPYAIGLGIGMMLFLHESFFPHRHREPSPLDIEMYRYEQTRKNYLQMKENNEKGSL